MLGSEGCLSLVVLRVVCVLVLKLMVVYQVSSEGSAPMSGRRGTCTFLGSEGCVSVGLWRVYLCGI